MPSIHVKSKSIHHIGNGFIIYHIKYNCGQFFCDLSAKENLRKVNKGGNNTNVWLCVINKQN